MFTSTYNIPKENEINYLHFNSYILLKCMDKTRCPHIFQVMLGLVA